MCNFKRGLLAIYSVPVLQRFLFMTLIYDLLTGLKTRIIVHLSNVKVVVLNVVVVVAHWFNPQPHKQRIGGSNRGWQPRVLEIHVLNNIYHELILHDVGKYKINVRKLEESCVCETPNTHLPRVVTRDLIAFVFEAFSGAWYQR